MDRKGKQNATKGIPDAESDDDGFQEPIIMRKRRVQDEAAAAISADKYKSTKRSKTKPNIMTNKTADDDAKECANQSSSASAKTSKKVNKRILSVKPSVRGIGRKNQYQDTLEKLVVKVHNITTHAYSFAKFMFISEINENMPSQFPLEDLLNVDFFSELWLSLTRRFEKRAHNKNTKRYRDLIERHFKDYLTSSGFKPEIFDNA
ncbi:hypothetical protein VTP01DRAFT_9406 [Rhizomucor pusillus]|uniref:uncharacterized protein n=1 Tax=Rhizomucor pusillus TaxID=4840 RepID=UPI0037430825